MHPTNGLMWTIARPRSSNRAAWRRQGDRLEEAIDWIKAQSKLHPEPDQPPPRSNGGEDPKLAVWLATLGLITIPTCPDELKRAYRRMASFWHPDCENGSEEGFKRLTVARDELSTWLGWGEVQ